MMRVIGLTGSIAMGKTTAAKAFSEIGIPVFDSDATVHRLYSAGGAGSKAISALVPQAIQSDAVDRQALARAIAETPGLLAQIEGAIHPLVRSAQEAFIADARNAGADLAVLDIPLLFETGRDKDVDIIIVVSAPFEIQRARAMARPGMTEEKLTSLLERQTPDAEKRRRADFIVNSSGTPDDAARQVREIVAQLRRSHDHA